MKNLKPYDPDDLEQTLDSFEKIKKKPKLNVASEKPKPFKKQKGKH